MSRPFLSGGAGYIMTRSVVSTMVDIVSTHDACLQAEGGAEDVTIATCLFRRHSVMLDEPTLDENGRDEFQAFCPLTLLDRDGGVYRFPVEWYANYRRPFGGARTGEHCCGRHTMTFHYVLPAQMRALQRSARALLSRAIIRT